MDKILLLLIVALLNGALVYMDTLLRDIIPISLYAERYMTLSTGVDLAESLYDILFSFGVALMILKFLKKGFEIYILWTDGDPDEEPLFLLTNFFRAMAVAICFPTIYTWLGRMVEDLTDQLLTVVGQTTDYNWQFWMDSISSMGLVTAVFGLIFIVCFFILYFQFLMRGWKYLFYELASHWLVLGCWIMIAVSSALTRKNLCNQCWRSWFKLPWLNLAWA